MKQTLFIAAFLLSSYAMAKTVEISAIGNTRVSALVGHSMKLVAPKAHEKTQEAGTEGACQIALAGDTPASKVAIEVDKNQMEIANSEVTITGAGARYARESGVAQVGFLLSFEGRMSGQQVNGEIFCHQDSTSASANTMIENLESVLKKKIQIVK